MSDTPVLFFVALLIISALYSSVGHGGASGYLALMAICGITPAVIKSTALVLNLFVSLIAFIQYYKTGNFKWNLLIPLVIASVPMAFLGGTITLNGDVYKKILGVLLVIAAFRFIYSPGKNSTPFINVSIPLLLIIGALIGLISGMIGIGGGIILTPIILLLGWADVKQTAGISALFIFVNSAAGLSGKAIHGIQFNNSMMLMIAIALIGGFGGSYIGSRLLVQNTLKRVLAVVLVIASIKLLLP